MLYREVLFDSRAFGKAVKDSRQCRSLTRNAVAEQLNISPRYLMSIENNGQHPSLQVFYNLALMFSISVDRFFFKTGAAQNAKREQVDSMLNLLSDADLDVLEGTIQGILKSKRAAQ